LALEGQCDIRLDFRPAPFLQQLGSYVAQFGVAYGLGVFFDFFTSLNAHSSHLVLEIIVQVGPPRVGVVFRSEHIKRLESLGQCVIWSQRKLQHCANCVLLVLTGLHVRELHDECRVLTERLFEQQLSISISLLHSFYGVSAEWMGALQVSKRSK
jgi:hypothetical protein